MKAAKGSKRLRRAVGAGLGVVLLALGVAVADQPKLLWSFDTGG